MLLGLIATVVARSGGTSGPVGSRGAEAALLAGLTITVHAAVVVWV